MRIRKNAIALGPDEKTELVNAFKKLKAKKITLVDGSEIGLYDQFVAIHLGVTRLFQNGTLLSHGGHNGGHGNAAFLSWHREFLRRVEAALREVSENSDLSFPYWDWANHEGTMQTVFVDNFIGGNATGPEKIVNGISFGNTVVTGPFAKDNQWPVDPRVHIRNLASWSSISFGDTLIRDMGSPDLLPTESDIEGLFASDSNHYEAFREAVEVGDRMHDDMHVWVGGSMMFMSSPNDPIFMLNHANIDRLWALWQADGHHGESHYPSTGEPYGHKLGDPMWPWDGGNTGVTTTPEVQKLIPAFTEKVTPRDVLDCEALGYGYVTWARIKQILDRAVERWAEKTGIPPSLDIHGEQFGWNSAEQLAESEAFGVRLIEPDKVGKNRGHETNLVVALKRGVPGFPRMPKGGPWVPKTEIAEIAHWIDSGMPE